MKNIYVVKDGSDYVFDRGNGWIDRQNKACRYTRQRALWEVARISRFYPDVHIVRLVPKSYIVCAHGYYVYSEFSYCIDARMALRFTKAKALERAKKEGPSARAQVEPAGGRS